MAGIGWFKYAYLAYVSLPKCDRWLYRLVKRRRVCRLVEVGVGRVERTAAMIGVCQRYAGTSTVSYTAIDWFDARAPQLAPLSLKESHRALQSTGAKVRLVPGDPGRALAATANALANTDLLVISHLVDDDDLQSAWFYVPRMLSETSLVLRERADGDGMFHFEEVTRAEVSARASAIAARRAA